MAQRPGFALSVGIILVAVLLAVAITTWAPSRIAGSNSGGSIPPGEVIYRPQFPLVY
jgi:hypothetical protein